eukprot:scaffold123436_cov60-Phaeocystis_antarctica.AAC.3
MAMPPRCQLPMPRGHRYRLSPRLSPEKNFVCAVKAKTTFVYVRCFTPHAGTPTWGRRLNRCQMSVGLLPSPAEGQKPVYIRHFAALHVRETAAFQCVGDASQQARNGLARGRSPRARQHRSL